MGRLAPPSPLFVQQLSRVRDAARLGPLADLACGRGRHCLAAAESGVRAIGVDRKREFLAQLLATAAERQLRLDAVCADLERPNRIPFKAQSCGVILVFRFLFRPLAAWIERALAPGGLLLYETFTVRQRELGYGPKNPAFLLGDGELRELFPHLEVLDYWEGVTAGARAMAVARLAARKPG